MNMSKEDLASSSMLAPRFLNISTASNYLGLSKWSLYRMVENRQIPFIPLSPSGTAGSKTKRPTLRFDRLALDRWMEAQTIPAIPLT